MAKSYSHERGMPIVKKRHREIRHQQTREHSSGRPNVVVDAGVLLDIAPVWHQCAQQTLRRELVQVANALSLPDRFGLSSTEALAVLQDFERCGGWARLELFPEARAMVCSLKELGACVWVSTSR